MRTAKKETEIEYRNDATTVDEAMEFAVNAIRGGNLVKGKAALGWILQRDHENAAAWFWLSRCLENEASRE